MMQDTKTPILSTLVAENPLELPMPQRAARRPSISEYYLAMAELASFRSTCQRRAVGCVIVDHHQRVVSIGYNGPPPGFVHCLDSPCLGAALPSGLGLDACDAVHAEQSALMACRDVHAIKAIYCTTSPCVSCVKLLLSTSCHAIYFGTPYAVTHDRAHKLWHSAGRMWIHGIVAGGVGAR